MPTCTLNIAYSYTCIYVHNTCTLYMYTEKVISDWSPHYILRFSGHHNSSIMSTTCVHVVSNENNVVGI